MSPTVEGVIRKVGTYTNGTPSLEIHVPLEAAGPLPVHLGARVPIDLHVGNDSFVAGLRATERSQLAWISPDLTDVGGGRTTLGRVLVGAGFRANDRITLIVERGGLRIASAVRARQGNASTRTRRAPSTLRGDAVPSDADPLNEFDWSSLYARYDAMCTAFRADSVHLSAVEPRVTTDRQLYYWLVASLSSAQRQLALDAHVYKALLYWKLYSQPAALHNIESWFSGDNSQDIARRLDRMIRELPPTLSRDWVEIEGALGVMNAASILGMRSSTALPVRTTVLHFLYPSTVPIFDKMVLKAVGMWSEGANTRLDVLKSYLPVAWRLGDAYEPVLTAFPETSVRLVDMALWVTRGAG